VPPQKFGVLGGCQVHLVLVVKAALDAVSAHG